MEIEGRRNPVTACTEPVKEGMVVLSDTPRVKRLRRTAAELIIAAHDVNCRSCGKNKLCELQKVAAYLGIKLKPERIRSMSKATSVDTSNPFFLRDASKCILCGKCVWVCNEQEGVGAIDFIRRGFDSMIAPFGDSLITESGCTSCGECVAICPVGALLLKDVQQPTEEIKSICPYCSVGCGIYLGIRDEKIVGVRGDHENEINKGKLCAKGRFGFGFVHHKDRLTFPLIKDGAGFVQTNWDKALDIISTKLSQYSCDQIGIIGSGKTSNEANYLLQKLARGALRTNNIDHYSRLCGLSPINPFRDNQHPSSFKDIISNAACIFVIGADPTTTHPVAGNELSRKARKSIKFLIADPHKTELCNHAGSWIQLRPGSDLALLMGMMQIIVDKELIDHSIMQEHKKDFPFFNKSLRSFDLDFVSNATGVKGELIAEAARRYATSKPAAIIYGTGISQYAQGTDNIHALNNLALLTGNAGLVFSLGEQNNSQGACDMGLLPDYYPGYQGTAMLKEACKHAQSSNHGMTMVEMLQAAHAGRIKALYVVGSNPLLTMPNTGYVRQALEKLEFLVVQDMFLSETAQQADAVLPAASFAETEGISTNFEGRLQHAHKAIKPVGESRPDWWIIAQIGKKLGAPGFDYENTSDIMNEVQYLGTNPAPATGYVSTEVKKQGSYYRDSKTFVPLTCKPVTLPQGKEYPFILIIRHNLYNTSMISKVEGFNLLMPEKFMEINPADAASLGITNGDTVQVISQEGDLTAIAKVTKSVLPGIVSMPFYYSKSPSNKLINLVLDPASNTPRVKPCAVRIEKKRM